MAYKIINGKLAAETDKNYLDVSSSKRELFDALKNQVQRAEAAEARAAELEAERDELRATLDDIKAATIMPDGTRLSDAVEQVMQERDRAIKRADTHAETIETLVNEKAQAEARAAELEAQLIGAASVVVTLTTERDGLSAKLAEIKSILAGGRTVGGDVEQAYRDAEEIAEDGAESYKAMTP